MHVLKNLDYYVEWLYKLLQEGKFHIHNKAPHVINEHNCNKERVIICPDFMPDLVVQHMVIKVLQPIFTKHFYYNSCASIPERGPNYGRKALQRFIRRNHTKRMYVFKFDIRRFFEHIDRKILMNKFTKLIHDNDFLKLLHSIIFFDDSEVGLPLGFYSSQWFSNFYLTEFDYFMKQTCEIPFVMRYMDDIVLIGFDKNHLRNAISKIIHFLMNDLHLIIKKNFQLYLFDNRDMDQRGKCIDYMGFKFYRDKITLRKRTLQKLRKKAFKIYKKYTCHKTKPNWYVCAQMISRNGAITHLDCRYYYDKYIKDKICLKMMRSIISNHSKRIAFNNVISKSNMMLLYNLKQQLMKSSKECII